MNKKNIVWAVIIIIVIIGVVWFVRGMSGGSAGSTASSTVAVSPIENTKVSSSLSQFKNEELGFSVNYPSSWQTVSASAGVTFIIPMQFPETTIGTLQSSIQVFSGKCAFPPVVSIKDRGTLQSGDLTFNTISMQNSVQGRNYFNRMYSLQKDSVCYLFSFASITLNPTTKGFSTSDVPRIQANNQSHIDDADAAFKKVVQSFAFVSTPAGQDETQVNPAKK